MKKEVICFVVFFLVSSFVCFSANSLALEDLGVNFRVPAQNEFHPGDIFYISLAINNPTQETYRQIPVFLVWWVGNEEKMENLMYCPPPSDPSDWHANDVFYYTIDVPPGVTEMEIIPTVEWPFTPGYSNSQYAGGQINFLTQMSNPALTKVFGFGDLFSFRMY